MNIIFLVSGQQGRRQATDAQHSNKKNFDLRHCFVHHVFVFLHVHSHLRCVFNANGHLQTYACSYNRLCCDIRMPFCRKPHLPRRPKAKKINFVYKCFDVKECTAVEIDSCKYLLFPFQDIYNKFYCALVVNVWCT